MKTPFAKYIVCDQSWHNAYHLSLYLNMIPFFLILYKLTDNINEITVKNYKRNINLKRAEANRRRMPRLCGWRRKGVQRLRLLKPSNNATMDKESGKRWVRVWIYLIICGRITGKRSRLWRPDCVRKHWKRSWDSSISWERTNCFIGR